MQRNEDKEHCMSYRFPTRLDGRIVPNGHAPPLECVVSDLSETGACLVLCEPGDLPLEFALEIPDEGARALVRLVWSNGRESGVKFI